MQNSGNWSESLLLPTSWCGPRRGYNNSDECINRRLKAQSSLKKQNILEFIKNNIKSLLEVEERMMERAIISKAPWRLQQQYAHLEVAEQKWCEMEQKEREERAKMLKV